MKSLNKACVWVKQKVFRISDPQLAIEDDLAHLQTSSMAAQIFGALSIYHNTKFNEINVIIQNEFIKLNENLLIGECFACSEPHTHHMGKCPAWTRRDHFIMFVDHHREQLCFHFATSLRQKCSAKTESLRFKNKQNLAALYEEICDWPISDEEGKSQLLQKAWTVSKKQERNELKEEERVTRMAKAETKSFLKNHVEWISTLEKALLKKDKQDPAY